MTGIIAFLAAVTVLLISGSWSLLVVKTISSFALVAFLPGFLILRLVLPNRRYDAAFILLSAGLSVSLTIVCGLILHGLHALNTFGWIACLGSICLAGLILGARRRGGDSPCRVPLQFKKSHFVAASIGFLCVSSAIVLAKQGSSEQREFTYTQLWMLPADERIFDSVLVGLKNEEQKGVFYDLEVLLDEKTIKRWPRFYLKEHEERVERVLLGLDDETRSLPDRSLQGSPKQVRVDSLCDEKGQARKERPTSARGFAADRRPCESTDEVAQVRYDARQSSRSGCAEKSGTSCREQQDSQGQARAKTVASQTPCSKTLVTIEQRPAMIRGEKQVNPCDQDHKIEARLYKNGNLGFLYRSVWLSRIDKEVR